VGRREHSPAVGCDEDPAERNEAVRVIRAELFGQRGWPHPQEFVVNVNLSLAPLVALIAGILILVMPRLLNYIVALYLIVIGLLGLFGGAGSFHLR
jgi:hypothetical protein